MRGLWWKALTGIWMTALIVGALVFVGPIFNDEGIPSFTMGGHGAKIIFFHVPCAWLACLAYVVAAFYAVQHLLFLRRPDSGDRPTCHWPATWTLAIFVAAMLPGALKSLMVVPMIGLAVSTWRPDALSDLKSATAMELGLVTSVLATVTGSIFSHNEWGQYWSWDPRQTSIVIIMLIFAAYIVLRGAVTDTRVRGRLCAAYALIAVVPGMFLIWVLPRVVETLHSGPNQAVVGGQLSPHPRLVLYALGLPAFVGLFAWCMELGVRFKRIEEKVQG